MQDENGLSGRADDVNMGGAMVGRVNDNPQAAYAQHRRHQPTGKNPSAWEDARPHPPRVKKQASP
jgi:hypothetical protein